MWIPVFLTRAFVAALVVLSGGCAIQTANKQTPAEPPPAPTPRRENVEAADAVSNEELGFEIRRRLNDNPAASAGIIVEVDDGKVTLRGTAPNLAAAWRAEAAARSVKGVKQVTNQILVAGSSR